MTGAKDISLAKPVAPEDLRPGMYVCALRFVREHLPDACFERDWHRSATPMRTLWLPWDGEPLKVVSVCLPFVLFERPCGRPETLDVRRVRLARVKKRYGKAVIARTKAARDRRRK